MQDKLARAQERMPPLSKLLGVKLTSLEKDRVTAEMEARPDMGNGSNILHGGAYMAFADYLGAIGTVLNLQKGQATTTMESKTNFFAPAPIGSIVKGESVPLHRGRRTQVWQTRLTNSDGRLLAMVTQTQMVLEAAPKSEQG